MSGNWVVATAVDIGRVVVRCRIPVPTAEAAGRLAHLVVLAGAVAVVEAPAPTGERPSTEPAR